jgi:hypothetical protein
MNDFFFRLRRPAFSLRSLYTDLIRFSERNAVISLNSIDSLGSSSLTVSYELHL